jgi:hypothetical protein
MAYPETAPFALTQLTELQQNASPTTFAAWLPCEHRALGRELL